MYIKKFFGYCIFSFFIWGFFSCTKDQWTIPTDFIFNFKLAENKIVNNYVMIEKGSAFLSSIEFEGKRQNAPGYSFSTPVNMKFNMNADTALNQGTMTFSIPQGIYYKIYLTMGFLYSGGYNSSNTQSPLITFTGYYNNKDGKKVPLKIDFNFEKIMKLSAKNSSIQDTIIIKSSKNNRAVINFNPYYWFQVLSRNDFETAEISNLSDFSGILINIEHNNKLYQLLANRIEESTQAIFW
jgi:hypothetical protein